LPYITEEQRLELDKGRDPASAGELNYCITMLVQNYMQSRGAVNYALINEAMGAMACARAEFYRRVAAPYEEKKRKENGDVYI
jgi:hypothetical protein